MAINFRPLENLTRKAIKTDRIAVYKYRTGWPRRTSRWCSTGCTRRSRCRRRPRRRWAATCWRRSTTPSNRPSSTSATTTPCPIWPSAAAASATATRPSARPRAGTAASWCATADTTQPGATARSANRSTLTDRGAGPPSRTPTSARVSTCTHSQAFNFSKRFVSMFVLISAATMRMNSKTYHLN